MTWNHRLIKHDIKKPFYLAVHEVFYDDTGKITTWTENPIDLTGIDRVEIVKLLTQIAADIKTPILSETKLLKLIDDNRIELIMTCPACPEQYDAYIDGVQVGYLRLRHGKFRVDFPDCGGETIYEAHPRGDGEFFDDEKELYLNNARKAIERKLRKSNLLHS